MTIKPYSKTFGWSENYSRRSEINPGEPEVTLESLEGQYRSFCGYAKDGMYKKSVFSRWGVGMRDMQFKGKGFQAFE